LFVLSIPPWFANIVTPIQITGFAERTSINDG
jgi:hypothetical protein